MNAEIILEQYVLGNGAEHCFYRRPHLENNPVCTFSAGSCRLEKGKAGWSIHNNHDRDCNSGCSERVCWIKNPCSIISEYNNKLMQIENTVLDLHKF